MSDINFLLLCEQVFAEAAYSRQLLQEALGRVVRLCNSANTIKINFSNLARLEQDKTRKQALKDMLLIELFRIRASAIQHILARNHADQLVPREQIQKNPDSWFDLDFAPKYFNDYPNIALLTKNQAGLNVAVHGILPTAPPEPPEQTLLPDNLPTFDENLV